jgi:hypothetical protein
MSIFSCKDTVRLASESLDRTLPWTRLVALHFHRIICPPCGRFYRCLLFLRAAVRYLDADAVVVDVRHTGLSPPARDRIRRALAQSDRETES